jgi:hypothetical protein
VPRVVVLEATRSSSATCSITMCKSGKAVRNWVGICRIPSHPGAVRVRVSVDVETRMAWRTDGPITPSARTLINYARSEFAHKIVR